MKSCYFRYVSVSFFQDRTWTWTSIIFSFPFPSGAALTHARVYKLHFLQLNTFYVTHICEREAKCSKMFTAGTCCVYAMW